MVPSNEPSSSSGGFPIVEEGEYLSIPIHIIWKDSPSLEGESMSFPFQSGEVGLHGGNKNVPGHGGEFRDSEDPRCF